MKKTIYLHGENSTEIKTVEIEELDGLPVLKELFVQEFKIPGPGDDYLVFAQEDEFFPDGEEVVITEVELVHLVHAHFHRCKKIATQVTYNGRVLDFEFKPGATGRKVMKHVLHKFEISDTDAAKLFLKTPGEVKFKATDHIGSLAGHHDCKVELLLVSKKLIEG
jgi:hypothetical protein